MRKEEAAWPPSDEVRGGEEDIRGRQGGENDIRPCGLKNAEYSSHGFVARRL
jgi:hypothetical protein